MHPNPVTTGCEAMFFLWIPVFVEIPVFPLRNLISLTWSPFLLLSHDWMPCNDSLLSPLPMCQKASTCRLRYTTVAVIYNTFDSAQLRQRTKAVLVCCVYLNFSACHTCHLNPTVLRNAQCYFLEVKFSQAGTYWLMLWFVNWQGRLATARLVSMRLHTERRVIS